MGKCFSYILRAIQVVELSLLLLIDGMTLPEVRTLYRHSLFPCPTIFCVCRVTCTPLTIELLINTSWHERRLRPYGHGISIGTQADQCPCANAPLHHGKVKAHPPEHSRCEYCIWLQKPFGLICASMYTKVLSIYSSKKQNASLDDRSHRHQNATR